MSKNEIWKNIKGYEGRYLISGWGNVKALSRSVPCRSGKTRVLKERILSPRTRKDRFMYVSIVREGVAKSVTIHRLVAEAFIKNPENKAQINHKDGDRTNNNVSNLEWVTPKENTRHAWKTGLAGSKGEKHYLAKLTEEDVLFIKCSNLRQFELAKKFHVSPSTIWPILQGKTWRHVHA